MSAMRAPKDSISQNSWKRKHNSAQRRVEVKKALKPRQPLSGYEFERSKLLSATLPLVTRMFLLGSLGSQSARRKSARRKSTSFSTPTSAALSSNSAISSLWRNSLASTAVCALRQLKLSCSALAWQVWGN